ncbi:MAG: sensor domain-containing diguanylate cyclase [Kluyvera sp.]|uniref:sensor domain-containing diguanylate cyclase n=1 Tax=Kluyvera sp. TaxID=1538228 RepID=UPI003A837D34
MKKNSPHHMLYLLVLVLILPFLLMSVYVYSYIQERAETDFYHEMSRVTDNVAIAVVSQPISEIKKLFRSLSNQLDAKSIASYIDPGYVELNTIIPTIVNSTVFFSSVVVSDDRDRQRGYPEVVPADFRIRESAWFPINGLKDEIHFSLPYDLHAIADKPALDRFDKAVVVSMNLFDLHSRYIGNIAFSLNLEAMSNPLKGLRIPYKGRFYVTAKDGSVILYQNSDEIFETTLPPAWLDKAVDGRGYFYDRERGTFVFYKRYDNPNWVAFTLVNKTDYLAVVAPDYRFFYFVFSVCTVLYLAMVMLIKLYFGQTITRLYMRMNGLSFEVDKKGIDTIYRELKAKNARLKAASLEATMDGLLKIYNRNKFDNDLEALIHRAQPFHLAFIDVDNFKAINDTYGHDVGDEVLKFISKTGKRLLGEGNTVYRFGGEELVAVFTQTSFDDSIEVLNGWRQLVFQREWRETGLRVSFSAGMTSWRPGASAADVVKQADAHLYAAKQSGKNRVVFTSNGV